MIHIGINGLGRIGKSILLQSLEKNNLKIKSINVPGYNIEKIASYLSHDSAHYKINPPNVEILDNDKLKINEHEVTLLNKRTPDSNMWKKHSVDYVFETTGKFLTSEKAKLHNSNYFIMCAPSKDNTPQFLYNGNHLQYRGEKIISNSSCTTNCIVPLIKILHDKYKIDSCNFITVHAATGSQNVLDGVHLKKRTHRSILNNIIPHTTGASKSAIKILPDLHGKIFGTSVRVPTNNVSMIDLNVKLNVDTSIEKILQDLRKKEEIQVNDDEHLVSSDFMTSTCPTIVDSAACMKMSPYEYKFTIWYDNEWSYSTQALKLLDHIYMVNNVKSWKEESIHIPPKYSVIQYSE